jgi:hypothetical protein
VKLVRADVVTVFTDVVTARAVGVVFGCEGVSGRGAGEVINSEISAFESFPSPPIDLLGIQPATPILLRWAWLMSERDSYVGVNF